MKRRPLTFVQKYIKFLLMLYACIAFAILAVAVQAFAETYEVDGCKIEDHGKVFVVTYGNFDVCLNVIGKELAGELMQTGQLEHKEVRFAIDRLVLSDKALKNELLAQEGGAAELFLGEKFSSNQFWAGIATQVKFEFRINDHVIFDEKSQGGDKLKVNLVDKIVLGQLL